MSPQGKWWSTVHESSDPTSRTRFQSMNRWSRFELGFTRMHLHPASASVTFITKYSGTTDCARAWADVKDTLWPER